MSTESLLELHDRLRPDSLRKVVPFSPDMADAARLLHMPFAADYEIAEGLNDWCRVWQPCQFGRLAAKTKQIAFCVLRFRDLADGDKAIREKIADAKQLWKQRAAYDKDRPPHSLLLVCATPELSLAAPDDNLRRFANRVRELAGWRPQRRVPRGENPVASDYLYLELPADGTFVGFQFNTDFFAAAGHGRWWQDHRFPGGIAFTANATGHMKAFRDRFGDPSKNANWALTQAMMTVAKAHPTKPLLPDAPPTEATARAEGRLTWLLDLHNGRPIVGELPCPYDPVPKQFANKDWTKYEGWIHTDHSVREEFFAGWDDPAQIAGRNLPLNDLTYLYDQRQEEYAKFTGGMPFTTEEVYADIGRPEEFRHRAGTDRVPDRTEDQAAEVAAMLHQCNRWELPQEEADAVR